MNKKIVVTGATKGIGKAIVQKFAANGFDVAFCARNKADIDTLKASLPTNIKVIATPCDVSNKQQLKQFADEVMAGFGTVDILINNAGIFLPGRVIDEADGQMEKLVETNLYSAYYISRWLLPAMLKNKGGYIFNMCSVASIQAYPNGGSYSISKFGLLGLSKALRVELMNDNIKVTALVSGATLTDSWKGTTLPDTRFMKAGDVAQIVCDIYNLSDNTVVEEVVLRPVLGDI